MGWQFLTPRVALKRGCKTSFDCVQDDDGTAVPKETTTMAMTDGEITRRPA